MLPFESAPWLCNVMHVSDRLARFDQSQKMHNEMLRLELSWGAGSEHLFGIRSFREFCKKKLCSGLKGSSCWHLCGCFATCRSIHAARCQTPAQLSKPPSPRLAHEGLEGVSVPSCSGDKSTGHIVRRGYQLLLAFYYDHYTIAMTTTIPSNRNRVCKLRG